MIKLKLWNMIIPEIFNKTSTNNGSVLRIKLIRQLASKKPPWVNPCTVRTIDERKKERKKERKRERKKDSISQMWCKKLHSNQTNSSSEGALQKVIFHLLKEDPSDRTYPLNGKPVTLGFMQWQKDRTKRNSAKLVLYHQLAEVVVEGGTAMESQYET